MPLPPVPDVYKIDVEMQYLGEEIHNVFYYRDIAVGGPSAESVAIGFWNKVKAAWRAIPTTTMNFTFLQVDVEQLFSPFGFFTYAIPTAEALGTRVSSSESVSAFDAMYIKLVVGTRATRPGGKRIAGWTEDQMTAGFFSGAAQTLGAALGAVLDDQFTANATAINLFPVVVGYPNANRPNVVVQDITGYLVDQAVSHQVSRDPRR